VWFIDSRWWHVDPERRIPEYLGRVYERVETIAVPGVHVALYRAPDTAASEGERGAGLSRRGWRGRRRTRGDEVSQYPMVAGRNPVTVARVML
jgi:hypothetical protein